MRPALLALLLVLAVGCRGPALSGARVDRGADSGPSTPAEKGNHPRNATERASAQSTAPTIAWTPPPQPGESIALQPGETVRSLEAAVWRASLTIADSRRYELLRACYCESGYDVEARGAANERGSCQVIEAFHGPVPASLAEQFAQADGIAAREGMKRWTTREGCGEWNR